MTKKEQVYRERVKVGVAFLNQFKPGWYKKISVDSLCITDYKLCPLAQVFGDWGVAKESLGLNVSMLDYPRAQKTLMCLGFSYASHNIDSKEQKFLTKEWTAVITKLQKTKKNVK